VTSIRRVLSQPRIGLEPTAAQNLGELLLDLGQHGVIDGARALDDATRLGARELAMGGVTRPELQAPQTSGRDEVAETFRGLEAAPQAGDDPVAARSAAHAEIVKDLLEQLGLDTGDGEGIDDEVTRQSIRDFQEDMGLKATGELDIETLAALLEAALNNDRRRSAERAARGTRQSGAAPSTGGTGGAAGAQSAGATSAQRPRNHVEPQQPQRTQPVDAANWKPGQGDVTPDQLQRIVPGLSEQKAREVAPHLNRAMAEANIDTPQRKAAFIAQLAHESGGFRHMEELASGRAYEGRRDLGNTQPGDGERFKGRGFIQVTGRANYTAASKALGEDFVRNPQSAATPENAARIAAWYWNSRGLNALADRGDFRGVTQRINGGQNGAADRAAYHARALDVLRDSHGAPATGRMVEETRRAGGTQPGGSTGPSGATTPSGRLEGSARGERFAREARAVAERMNTVGYCAKGVGDALQRMGINQRGHAYQHAEMFARRSDFKEVNVGREDLRSLPPGAVVVWGRSDAKPYGHIAVSLGNGLEASDHVQRMVTSGSYGTDFGRGATGRQFRVFIPQ
jgi:predicted chitinase